MGNLVTGHIVKVEVDFNQLMTLPTDIVFKAYRHADFEFRFLDFYKIGRENLFPFQHLLPQSLLPERLPKSYDSLNLLHQMLEKAGLSFSFPRSILNLNLAVSALLDVPAASFAADDDELDFFVQSNKGSLTRLHFLADDLEILWENREIHIHPLIGDDVGETTDLSVFQDSMFIVHERTCVSPLRLSRRQSRYAPIWLNRSRN